MASTGHKITRRAALASVGAAVAAPALAAIGRGVAVPGIGGGGGGGTLTTLAVSNPGPGILAANSFIQFGHGYGATDIPSGNILSIVDDLSSSVPYTAMRRSTGGGTSVRYTDNIARLPNSIAAPLTVSSITHTGATATVTTSAPHGLSTGAQVHMEGQAPDDYCGLYTITSTGASTFTYLMPTTPATNATTAGTMNYTRVLTLSSVAGTWNNTLPNSKTPTNIITDITTNFDNLTLTLSSVTNSAGSTVASGTFNADLATALAASGTAGQLRTPSTGQGQLVCDIVALMKFNDNITPATHLGTMSAWFYLTAFLDQTTGAVQELRCRVWVDNALSNAAMDFYTYQAKLTLGATIVRSSGLSTNSAIDGKVQSFAPAAVNTSTGVMNIPNHGFVGGETIRLTTSGTLPSGWTLNTDWAVIWVDGNNIMMTSSFDEGNQIGNSSPVIPSTQGSGTHTATCWLHSAFRNRIPYARTDGLADRWTGKTGAFAPQLTHCIHSNNYLQSTKMVPAVDLSINLATKAAVISNASTAAPANYANKDRFCYGAFGSLEYAQDAGGAGAFHEYGGPWSDKPLRRLRYCNDRGFAQTLRVDSLMEGAWDMSLIKDDTIWRTPVCNNGPDRAGATYTGMSASDPTAQWFKNVTPAIVGFTLPTSFAKQNGVGALYSFSHRYILLPRLYFFEGGQDIHDFMVIDSLNTLLPKSDGVFPTALQTSFKRFLIGGTQYFTANPDGSEPRTDAWMAQILFDGKMLADDSCPEKPYITDILNDTMKAWNFLANTYGAANDPNFLVIGGLPYGETAKGGPGATSGTSASFNCDANTAFFQSYLGETIGHCRRMYGSSNSDLNGIVTQLYALVDNLYRLTAGNGWIGNSYSLRTKQAPNLNISPNGALSIAAATDPMIEDSNLSHPGCILFRTDGLVIGCSTGNVVDVFPATGDKHYLTDSDASGSFSPIPANWSGPPAAVKYSTLFVRQASGTYFSGWKLATTNSDATIVGSYAAVSSSTLNGAINASQTSVTTNAPLFFPTNALSDSLRLIVVGSEIMAVTGGIVRLVTTGTTVAGSAVLSMANTTGVVAGMGVTDENNSNIPAATTVLSVNPGVSVTLTANATGGGVGNGDVIRFVSPTLTVTRAQFGSTGASALNGAAIYVPYTSTLYADLQNRVVAFPPTGHAYRITGSAAATPDGYLTMMRAQAFYGYLCGVIPRTAFENADAWWQDVIKSTGVGGSDFAANNTLKDSVNASLTS